ncbi:SDR family NAD(P)-dependent oxidoreductase [Ensifer adhaerens]|uniref:SDR family NAD(P)-dependent oxidoreductase n=1 Tax=Ensifer adhaerens TaxID=106592 RepID=UPI000FDA9BA0|nr:SDR family oxidoreductase [Ensifer adhaerens]MDF8357303.1 SDR family NAD(P)-dependent oxidoreductase [Ensifer adhaerens]THA58981.1 SDR family oxidoreductase [Ensifer adhaerens]
MNEQNNTGGSWRLAGRRILVTGAASGIGKATAELFALEGALVACLDRNASAVIEVASAIGGYATAADITDEGDVAKAVNRIHDNLGEIDGLVNAAGIMATGSIRDMPVALWRQIIDVNLIGTYLVTKSCVRFLQGSETGTIVNIASAQGLLPNVANHTAYAASKGAVVNLSRALAAELSPQIRVNAVCPGMVDTPMALGNGGKADNYAMKRVARPDEIASAILFLTCQESSYVTGAALAVDGGRSFH